MSTYEIARSSITSALEEAAANAIPENDLLHAMLVSLVEIYKAKRGIEDTREALQFQAENLTGDEDFAFMRP